jgi:hypothetical protein
MLLSLSFLVVATVGAAALIWWVIARRSSRTVSPKPRIDADHRVLARFRVLINGHETRLEFSANHLWWSCPNSMSDQPTTITEIVMPVASVCCQRQDKTRQEAYC